MARHRKYSRKRRGQKRNRMRSRKMRGGNYDDMEPLTIEDLTDDVDDENKKRTSPFDSPEPNKPKRTKIDHKEIYGSPLSYGDEDDEQSGGKRRRTNKRKTKRTRKNRKRRQRGGIVIL
jgi:hypothetical protein